MTFSLLCKHPSRYCVEYSNGTYHDVGSFELLVVVFAILAMVGYLRASQIYQHEREEVRRMDSADNEGLLHVQDTSQQESHEGRDTT